MKTHDLIAYDSESGMFRWLVDRRRGSIKAGSVAGCARSDGYVGIVIDGRRHYAHRLAWEMARGAIPSGMEIDHIDHNPSNNRLCNLRLVTKAENRRNRSPDSRNRSGVNGVYWASHAKAWAAQIRFNRSTRHLGFFASLDAARDARRAAEHSLSFHPNHGVAV